MISVPNLRQPLNGNKLVLFLLMLATLLAGCGIFGPVSKRPDTREDEEVVKGDPDQTQREVDTIIWNQQPEEVYPPITERAPSRLTGYKDLYNIVLLAPFGARQLQYEIDRPSVRMVRMIEFLAGVQYGLDFCIDDVNIHLTVIDTEQDPQFITRFTDNQALQDADIIIGPYYTDQVEAVLNFAATQKKIVVSPWNTADLRNGNSDYIQLRPSLKTHSRKLAEFARSRYRPEEIMLITRNDQRDLESLAFFQDPPETDSTGTNRIRELIIQDIGNSDLNDSMAVYIQERGYHGFIIPVWQDEPFVIATLAKLSFAKAEQPITVFGLPQWMEMSRMDFDYFENLQVHLSSARPVAYPSKDALGLKSHYISRFGDTPGSDAYYGLNVIKWLASLLKSEGVDIVAGLSRQVPDLDFDFNFTSIFGEDGESIHHYENQAVHILRFSNYEFEQVD